MIRRNLAERPAIRVQSPSLTALPAYVALVRQLAGQVDSPIIRSIGVTSSRAGEGVSTIALQLATAAERLFRQPVLLVETSVRRPSLHRALQLDKGPGLGELLLGSEERDNCIQRVAGNLFAVTAGTADAKQRAACSGEAIARTVDALQEGQRITVWDLPAIGDDPLGVEFARQLDGVLLVVEAERVLTDDAQNATDQLRGSGAKLLGAVLNKERQHVPGWLAARI